MSKTLVATNIKIGIDDSFETVINKLSKEGVRCDLGSITILKKSLDARDKSNLKFVYNLAINGDYKINAHPSNKILDKEIKRYKMPLSGKKTSDGRHVIVGSGPAGLFAGLLLARCGHKPLIIERGEPIDDRTKTVSTFWQSNKLSTKSNVCFGEGGAGTFSDGKLNTGIKDGEGRIAFVLDEFVKAGADESIAYWYKPHIGSDVLANVVKNIRNEIIDLGGEFLFNSQLVDIKENASLKLIVDKDGILKEIDSESVILAIGHSARDTYKMLNNIGVNMKSKAFAVGMRIEHPQDMINRSQYGDNKSKNLPVADYKVSTRSKTGRGVYSFCMCPGGMVVNSSSEEEGLLVNGMSLSGRNGRNANAAIIASVDQSDFGDEIFDGMNYQRRLEELAFKTSNGAVPIQKYEDFNKEMNSKCLGGVAPDICGLYDFGNLRNIFNDDICNSISEGIEEFGKHIEGFDRGDAILSGVESRTSSPIKIYRDEHFESNIKGLFPCGEGCGYAGGIMSAAIDGIKVAEEIIRRYKS